MTDNNTTAAKDAKQPLLGNNAYNTAKDATTIWLPALATLYAALSAIWHLPFSVEVVGTIGALVVFLGVVLKISSDRYNNLPVLYNGELKVNMTDPMSDNFKLEIDEPWDALAKNEEIRIKVVDESDPIHLNGKD